jgi:biofilm PGA synthesis lipoprotein PgaB
MRGTFLCSLLLVFAPLAGQAPPSAPDGGRRHEIQFRRNDYAAVAAPERLLAAGLSKAILRVFSDDEPGGGLYFSSGFFPVVRPALDQWARDYSGKPVPLWAWMGARRFAWLSDPLLLDRGWSAGEARPIAKLDLFNPRAFELIGQLFKRLAAQAIQGILIQDDLAISHGEGLSSWGKASFSRASGLPADPRAMLAGGSTANRTWEDIKAARVSEVLAHIVAACRQANPAVAVGLNVHYEAPLTPQRARSWYAFDVAGASASGVDYFYLMAYHRQMKAEMGLGEGENRLHFRRMLEAALGLWGTRLAVKMQVRDWKTSEPIPLAELKAYYDLIPAGVERVCFAAADPEDLDLISKVISMKSVTSEK